MRAEQGWTITRFFITAAGLYAVWLLFSTNFSGFSLFTGAAGAILLAGLTYDVFIARHDAGLGYFMPKPAALLLFLLIMILLLYQSSFRMLLAVITGRSNPRFVHFRTRIKSDLGRMVLANAITMTPGTITLDLNDDHLTVHWLFSSTTHSKAAGEAIKGRMERLLRRVWL